MTRLETFPPISIADKELVLATDLDGTFLGGSAAERKDFYAWIEANRTRVGLIFVTGRDPGFIRQLTLNEGVPRPDYAIADVGTTIAEVTPDHFIAPIPALEAEIASAWDDASDRVQRALFNVKGLSLQSTLFRYRASYDMDPASFDPSVLSKIEEMGLDTLVSDNRFVDVLPRGVSKGPSLLRLLAHLGIPHDRTLVAGDTLNDLSMLALGLPAVAVGGSEDALIRELTGQSHVHLAKGIGVAGIAEAIRAHPAYSKA